MYSNQKRFRILHLYYYSTNTNLPVVNSKLIASKLYKFVFQVSVYGPMSLC